MKPLKNLLVPITIIFALWSLPACETAPIEHGTEYLLRVADGTDTAATRKTFLVLENRLKNFELEGDYEVTMLNGDIRVRIRDGVQYDQQRLRNLLQSSAGLTFRATYMMSEVVDNINEAHETFLRVNHMDSANSAGTGFTKYLIPDASGNYSAALIAYCLPRDTAAVNAILRHDSIAPIFPFDLVFHWGTGITMQDGQQALGLFACKTGRNYELSGEHVATAESKFNEESGSASPEISITFDQSGTDEWSRMTKSNIGRSIAIELDDFVYSYPTVYSEINGGQAVITGNFTEAEARDLAMLLNAGQMPNRVHVVEEKTF